MAFSVMERLQARERALLGALGVVLGLAVGNYAVAVQIRNKFRDMDCEIARYRALVEGNYYIIALGNDIRSQFEKVKSHVPQESLDKVIPRMQTEIEQLATRCGVAVLDRKGLDPEPLDFFQKNTMRIEVQGAMSGVMTLLHEMEASGELLRVDKLDLSQVAKGGEKTTRGAIVVNKIVPRHGE